MDVRREQPLTGQIWWVFMLRGVLAAVLGIFALMQGRVEVIPSGGPIG